MLPSISKGIRSILCSNQRCYSVVISLCGLRCSFTVKVCLDLCPVIESFLLWISCKELLKETMPKHKAVLIWYFISSEECSSLIDGVDVFVNFKVKLLILKLQHQPLQLSDLTPFSHLYIFLMAWRWEVSAGKKHHFLCIVSFSKQLSVSSNAPTKGKLAPVILPRFMSILKHILYIYVE